MKNNCKRTLSLLLALLLAVSLWVPAYAAEESIAIVYSGPSPSIFEDIDTFPSGPVPLENNRIPYVKLLPPTGTKVNDPNKGPGVWLDWMLRDSGNNDATIYPGTDISKSGSLKPQKFTLNDNCYKVEFVPDATESEAPASWYFYLLKTDSSNYNSTAWSNKFPSTVNVFPEGFRLNSDVGEVWYAKVGDTEVVVQPAGNMPEGMGTADVTFCKEFKVTLDLTEENITALKESSSVLYTTNKQVTLATLNGWAKADEGYALKWYVCVDDTEEEIQGDSFLFDGQKMTVIKAVAEAIPSDTYTATFAAGEGAQGNAPTSLTAVKGGTITLPDAGGLTKEGHTFTGWDYNGTTYKAGTEFTMPGENVTFTAQWEPKEYTVTFNADGGTPEPEIQRVKYEGSVTEPPSPTKAGYEFAGWYVALNDEITEEKFDFINATISFDLTLKAKWEPESYTITWDPNGGKWKDDNSLSARTEKHSYGETITAPDHPVCNEELHDENGDPIPGAGEGGIIHKHYFAGWSTAKDGEVLNTVPKVTEDATYYAIWDNANHWMLTANPNYDGGPVKKYWTGRQGDTTGITVLEPERTGHTFVGWYTDKDCTTGNEFTMPKNLTKDTEIFAKWTVNRYTVTFTTDGGSEVPPQQVVEHGQTVTKPADPAKEGYTFKGWLLDGRAYDFSTQVTKDITLTASWEENTPAPKQYTAYFTNGTDTVSETHAAGDAFQLPVNPFYREGYFFTGWNDGTQTYNAGWSYTMPAYDVIFTAQWEENLTPVLPPSIDTSRPADPRPASYPVNDVTDKAAGGSVMLSAGSAAAGSTVTITAVPDEGYEVDNVTAFDRNGYELELTSQGNGVYMFTMPSGRVSVECTFKPATEQPPQPEEPPQAGRDMPFTDVGSGDWFHDAVRYVYDAGIMKGDGSETAFNPDGKVNRAMVWTILGRLSGADVDGSDGIWYAKAQAWAIAAGVTDGTDPDGRVTREQLVTMLWRYFGSPAAGADLGVFSDGDAVSAWALDAMRWAVSTGLVNGENNRLNPGEDATRAQVAALLMRFCQNTEILPG